MRFIGMVAQALPGPPSFRNGSSGACLCRCMPPPSDTASSWAFLSMGGTETPLAMFTAESAAATPDTAAPAPGRAASAPDTAADGSCLNQAMKIVAEGQKTYEKFTKENEQFFQSWKEGLVAAAQAPGTAAQAPASASPPPLKAPPPLKRPPPPSSPVKASPKPGPPLMRLKAKAKAPKLPAFQTAPAQLWPGAQRAPEQHELPPLPPLIAPAPLPPLPPLPGTSAKSAAMATAPAALAPAPPPARRLDMSVRGEPQPPPALRTWPCRQPQEGGGAGAGSWTPAASSQAFASWTACSSAIDLSTTSSPFSTTEDKGFISPRGRPLASTSVH